MVYEKGKTTRIFQLNQEIKANKDGYYTLKDSYGNQSKFSYSKGLFKMLN
jgi:hypothetical protein